ncbi:MAG: hypothetical protein Tsb005_15480 [Gammaproteobacteria bacterium]
MAVSSTELAKQFSSSLPHYFSFNCDMTKDKNGKWRIFEAGPGLSQSNFSFRAIYGNDQIYLFVNILVKQADVATIHVIANHMAYSDLMQKYPGKVIIYNEPDELLAKLVTVNSRPGKTRIDPARDLVLFMVTDKINQDNIVNLSSPNDFKQVLVAMGFDKLRVMSALPVFHLMDTDKYFFHQVVQHAGEALQATHIPTLRVEDFKNSPQLPADFTNEAYQNLYITKNRVGSSSIGAKVVHHADLVKEDYAEGQIIQPLIARDSQKKHDPRTMVYRYTTIVQYDQSSQKFTVLPVAIFGKYATEARTNNAGQTTEHFVTQPSVTAKEPEKYYRKFNDNEEEVLFKEIEEIAQQFAQRVLAQGTLHNLITNNTVPNEKSILQLDMLSLQHASKFIETITPEFCAILVQQPEASQLILAYFFVKFKLLYHVAHYDHNYENTHLFHDAQLLLQTYLQHQEKTNFYGSTYAFQKLSIQSILAGEGIGGPVAGQLLSAMMPERPTKPSILDLLQSRSGMWPSFFSEKEPVQESSDMDLKKVMAIGDLQLRYKLKYSLDTEANINQALRDVASNENSSEIDIDRLVNLLKAEVDAQDTQGKTALHYAALNNNDLYRVLIDEFEADENIKDNAGKTAADYLPAETVTNTL